MSDSRKAAAELEELEKYQTAWGDSKLNTPEVLEAQKQTNKEQQIGVKHDSNKPRLSLVHGSLLRACARSLEHGLSKYPANDNWKKVDNPSVRYLDALLRHAHDLADGIEFDQDGQSHLDAMAANLMFLCFFAETDEE